MWKLFEYEHGPILDRMLTYMDDHVIFFKDEEVDTLLPLILDHLKLHGMVVQPKKTNWVSLGE